MRELHACLPINSRKDGGDMKNQKTKNLPWWNRVNLVAERDFERRTDLDYSLARYCKFLRIFVPRNGRAIMSHACHTKICVPTLVSHSTTAHCKVTNGR
jgi:hypothetical protein